MNPDLNREKNETAEKSRQNIDEMSLKNHKKKSEELLHDEILQVMGLSSDFIADLDCLGELGNGRFQTTLASHRSCQLETELV